MEDLWNAEDPSKAAQNLLLEHLDAQSEIQGHDLNSYSENENRYEPN